jgi:dethiobiotin synthetase
MSKQHLFIAGIGTDVGKTVVAAIFTEALQADYWKPVQSGSMQDSDTNQVKVLISNPRSRFHPEVYQLPLPLSPHAAAAAAGVSISLPQLQLPTTDNHLIIEGAGGLLVPLNDKDLLIDFISQSGCDVVLVSKNYLGSINHTLLSWEALQRRSIKVLGLIFNGEPTPATEEFILQYTGLPKLLSILPEENINAAVISRYARQLQKNINLTR